MKSNNSAKLIRHPDTGFISVKGKESCEFLQSIVTANVETLGVHSCRPSALLTPQGRVLVDMMIYRLDEDYFILRCDAARRDNLFIRLRRYRLRRPIELAIEPSFQLCILMPDDNTKYIRENNEIISSAAVFSSVDPRCSTLGIHMIFHDDQLPETNGEISYWHTNRIAAGIPEGPIDLIPERALMLEAGLDELGAVDFEKGCYVGQEVTARTHYRGLVKRRLVPIMVLGGSPKVNSPIIWNDKIIGHSKTVAPHPESMKSDNDSMSAICLALLKLADLNNIIDCPDGHFKVDGNDAALALPKWMIPLPRLT